MTSAWSTEMLPTTKLRLTARTLQKNTALLLNAPQLRLMRRVWTSMTLKKCGSRPTAQSALCLTARCSARLFSLRVLRPISPPGQSLLPSRVTLTAIFTRTLKCRLRAAPRLNCALRTQTEMKRASLFMTLRMRTVSFRVFTTATNQSPASQERALITRLI